jgi:7-cyano-7-deazaguanine synthase in queuosine biosynthesis
MFDKLPPDSTVVEAYVEVKYRSVILLTLALTASEKLEIEVVKELAAGR